MGLNRCKQRDCNYFGQPTDKGCACHKSDEAVLRETLNTVLEAAKRAIGDHNAPGDCYATGPLTGGPYRDLVECPACSFLALVGELENATPSESTSSWGMHA